MKLSAHEKFMRHLEAKAAAKRAAEKVEMERKNAEQIAKAKKKARIEAAMKRDKMKLEILIEHAQQVAGSESEKSPSIMKPIYKENKDILLKLYVWRYVYKTVYNDFTDLIFGELAIAKVKKQRRGFNRRLQKLNRYITYVNKAAKSKKVQIPKHPML